MPGVIIKSLHVDGVGPAQALQRERACALGSRVRFARAPIPRVDASASRCPTARRLHAAYIVRALPSSESGPSTSVLESPPPSASRVSHTLEQTDSHASHDDDVELDLEEQELKRGHLRPEAPQVAFVSLVDGKYTVQGRLLLRAPAAEVYELLTDYAGCHRVFSNIAASSVLTGPDGGKQVEQLCRWKFLAFSGTFKVQLGVVEDAAARTLLFNLVQSSFMSDFEGRWAVAPAAPPPGAAPVSADEQWCEVQHTLSVVPAVPVPAPVAFYTRSIFVKQVEGILRDLQGGLPRWRAERS